MSDSGPDCSQLAAFLTDFRSRFHCVCDELVHLGAWPVSNVQIPFSLQNTFQHKTVICSLLHISANSFREAWTEFFCLHSPPPPPPSIPPPSWISMVVPRSGIEAVSKRRACAKWGETPVEMWEVDAREKLVTMRAVAVAWAGEAGHESAETKTRQQNGGQVEAARELWWGRLFYGECSSSFSVYSSHGRVKNVSFCADRSPYRNPSLLRLFEARLRSLHKISHWGTVRSCLPDKT